VLVLLLAACGPDPSDTAVEVAAGTVGGPAWVARAGLAGASGICLEVKVEGNSEGDRLCGLHEGESGLWRFDVAGGSFVTGMVDDPRAASARLTLADGSEGSATVAGAGSVTSLRFYVLVVAPGAALDRLEILDDAGVVIDFQPVD
jgi:hypothetical protein